MPVKIADVEHVAKLARLQFTRAEMEKFTHQLNQILAYMEKLNELDTKEVEPFSRVVELKNRLRADEVQSSSPVGEILKNAPATTQR